MPEGEAVRRWALAHGWESRRVERLILGTLNAARGLFGRAEIDVARALDGSVGKPLREDTLIRAYRARLTLKRRKASGRAMAGPFAAEVVGPAEIEGLRSDTQNIVMRATVLRAQGDYDRALPLYKEARALAGVTGDRAVGDALADAAVWTRALQAQRDERLAPGARDAAYRRHRELAAAMHAWELAGALLDHTGDTGTAIGQLRAARAYFRDHDPEIAAAIDKEISAAERKPRERRAAVGLSDDLILAASLPYRSIPAATARAYIVMDAMEYALGDWSRSEQFIRLHLEADPDNPALKEALAFVQGLSAGRGG